VSSVFLLRRLVVLFIRRARDERSVGLWSGSIRRADVGAGHNWACLTPGRLYSLAVAAGCGCLVVCLRRREKTTRLAH
jgi:hypothetical protein